jgi:hypothetical protein
LKVCRFTIETLGFLLILIFVVILFSYAIYTINWQFSLIIAFFSGIVGGFLIPFGFWGADFAFGIAIRHIDQSKEGGKIKGIKNMVYLPFLRNYTLLEWWNISWFITVIGLILAIISSFVFGYSLSKILMST